MEEIKNFWGSLVHDKQLHQLDVQLTKVEVKLIELRGSIKMMPPLAQVTKKNELKEVQQCVNKAHSRHQQRKTH